MRSIIMKFSGELLLQLLNIEILCYSLIGSPVVSIFCPDNCSLVDPISIDAWESTEVISEFEYEILHGGFPIYDACCPSMSVLHMLLQLIGHSSTDTGLECTFFGITECHHYVLSFSLESLIVPDWCLWSILSHDLFLHHASLFKHPSVLSLLYASRWT